MADKFSNKKICNKKMFESTVQQDQLPTKKVPEHCDKPNMYITKHTMS